MAKLSFVLLAGLLLMLSAAPLAAGNPFQGDREGVEDKQARLDSRSFFQKVAHWQQEIKSNMASMIGKARKRESIRPLFLIVLLAFVYGMVHAAGPGHGKSVATTYILSRRASVAGGAFFGAMIALFHGLSGAVCVLGLHYVLQKSVGGTLDSVSQSTRIISFALIFVLGAWIAVSHGRELFGRTKVRLPRERSRRSLLFWAVTVGLVPCPGVVMVMLFCLSLGMFALGFILAAAVSLGMAVTVALVVVCVVAGRNLCLGWLSNAKAEKLEQTLGLVSGTAVCILGGIFLRAAML
jgi:ABC-type nickel/cobalt efflux system permease component RcnA